MSERIQPPYPWFGGKRKIAPEVWKRFGNVSAYAEPFLGGGAVFLARPPGFSGVEFVNDVDGFVTNFWRAAKHDSVALVDACCDLASEIDIAAKQKLLIENRAGLTQRLINDISYHDTVLAGYWWLGARLWLGGLWCATDPGERIPIQRPKNQWTVSTMDNVRTSLSALKNRLNGAVILSGDWSRCVTQSYLGNRSAAAVFLDPPYSGSAVKDSRYACEDKNVSAGVLQWCLEHSSDEKTRIAFCGYDGEDGVIELDLLGWEKLTWGACGFKRSGARHNDNSRRERVWFSPSCLKVSS